MGKKQARDVKVFLRVGQIYKPKLIITEKRVLICAEDFKSLALFKNGIAFGMDI